MLASLIKIPKILLFPHHFIILIFNKFEFEKEILNTHNYLYFH